uniref:Pulmonary surfactant-associated protein B n=1 Tax=Pseudonaja textilis TaxID=8673 RepID=A0A670ZIS0_PSETE
MASAALLGCQGAEAADRLGRRECSLGKLEVLRGSPFFFQEDMCADCKQVLSILVRMAKESAFQKTLQKYLEDECTNLPLQTLIPQCQALVKDYYARLIASLEKKLDPSIICTHLGACPADLPGSQDGLRQLLRGLERGLLPQLHGQVPTLPSGHTQAPGELLLPIPMPLCWLCKMFIGKAESVIPKVRHPPACQVRAVAGMCQCLMEKYTVIIVDTLVSKLGPRLVCGMMLMCASEENCGPGTKALRRLSLSLLPQGRANRTRRAVEAALSSACSPSFSSWPQVSLPCHLPQEGRTDLWFLRVTQADRMGHGSGTGGFACTKARCPPNH